MRNQHSTPARLLATILAAAMALLPAAAFAQRAGRGANNPIRNIPIAGTAQDGQTFTGTLDIERFEAAGDQLLAVGQVNGKFSGGTPVNHQSVAVPVQSVTAGDTLGFGAPGAHQGKSSVAPATWDPRLSPTVIQAQAGTCDVLTLVLGPLHLDLLGLVVDLNQVNLRITAQQGPGNLLGNLLFAVCNLLNPGGGLGGALTTLADALSALANALNGLGL